MRNDRRDSPTNMRSACHRALRRRSVKYTLRTPLPRFRPVFVRRDLNRPTTDLKHATATTRNDKKTANVHAGAHTDKVQRRINSFRNRIPRQRCSAVVSAGDKVADDLLPTPTAVAGVVFSPPFVCLSVYDISKSRFS